MRLGLERLEDRLTPSALTLIVDGGSDTPTDSSAVAYAQLLQVNFQKVTPRDALDAPRDLLDPAARPVGGYGRFLRTIAWRASSPGSR